jgi:hypothetical protein
MKHKDKSDLESIFDICDDVYLRTKDVDKEYYACRLKGECPYKNINNPVRIKLWSSNDGELIVETPRCDYKLVDKL